MAQNDSLVLIFLLVPFIYIRTLHRGIHVLSVQELRQVLSISPATVFARVNHEDKKTGVQSCRFPGNRKLITSFWVVLESKGNHGTELVEDQRSTREALFDSSRFRF